MGKGEKLAQEAAKMDMAIQAANERMVYVTGDKEAIRAYEMRMMALSDRTSELNYAHDEGLKKGLRKGTLEIARKMKIMGDPIEKIHTITGLPTKTLKRL